MSIDMIEKLIAKDWYLQRWTVLGYLLGGAVAIGLLGFGGEAAFTAGMILLITVLMALGIHIAMVTVVIERTEKTLPFIMSLPVSPIEYATAKIAANLLIFLVPWTALVLGAVAVILARGGVPDGLLPYSVLTLTIIFVNYCIVLCAALVSESHGWTIAVMMVCNLGFQAFIFTVSRIDSIAATIKGPVVVWTTDALAVLGAEIATVVIVLAVAYWLQARKTDFL